MHQSIPPAPSTPPGYRGAFTRLVSPGGGAFANFAQPGGRAFVNPGPFPSFWAQVELTDALSIFILMLAIIITAALLVHTMFC